MLAGPGELKSFADEAAMRGQGAAYLVEANRPLAAFAVADAVRPESAEAAGARHGGRGRGNRRADRRRRGSGDIVLVRSDPRDVPRIVNLSRASYRKMVQNLWWAAGYNIFAIPLAAGVLAPWGVLLTPAAGAVLMSASTIVVAVNAQLLRRVRL